MRRSISSLFCISMSFLAMITGCTHKVSNPIDPFESFNRKVHNFNMAVDATMVRPPARLYYAVVPAFARKGVNNAFNNLEMLPVIANDILQVQGKWIIKDAWRFVINSSIGIGGLFDVAESFGLPPHYNDLGLTFARWGNKTSPYLVLPLLGPSTVRDGTGWLFQFVLWTPYIYLNNTTLSYSLVGLRYLDIRTQLFESERLMQDALDSYSFIRDAYLQHRSYLISGATENISSEQDDGALYVEEL